MATTSIVKGTKWIAPFGNGGTITGHVAPGWEDVRAGFEKNFALNLELGSQLVIYEGEEVVVDLVGHSSKQLDYTADTLQCVFSSGKNMEAICFAMLVDRGLLSYDDLVIKHWPEFGKHGKDVTTIADVLQHQSGLPAFTAGTAGEEAKNNVSVTKAQLLTVDGIDATIENSGLVTPVGTRCYHAVTRGWILSAILRRVDPKHRTLGVFMREEICGPLGELQYFCGIPKEEQSTKEFANMTQIPLAYNLTFEIIPALFGGGDPCLAAAIKIWNKNNIMFKMPAAAWMGKQPTPAFNNTAEGRAAEIPSAGMYTHARAMAKINALMANGGEIGGVRLMSEEGCKASMSNLSNKPDVGFGWEIDFGQGGFADFSNAKGKTLDPEAAKCLRGFHGWGGWGGSLSVWNPEKKVAISYTMNAMSNYLIGGERVINHLTPIFKKLYPGA